MKSILELHFVVFLFIVYRKDNWLYLFMIANIDLGV